MARVVVSEFVSVDGVIEDPGGSEGWDRGGWAFNFDRGPEGDKFKLDEVMASDALLRLFSEGSDSTALRLLEAKPAGECLILTYAPAAKEEA